MPPINAIERGEDREGIWRRYVNDRLSGDYADFFEHIDLALMLRAPSFECVHGWRAEQEAGLLRNGPLARLAMDDAELARFIHHYERITRRQLLDEPADLIVDLDENRVPVAWRRGPTIARVERRFLTRSGPKRLSPPTTPSAMNLPAAGYKFAYLNREKTLVFHSLERFLAPGAP